MKGPIQWMANNHVAANLLMLAFVVGGLVLGVAIKQEVFPEIELDKVQVSVAYPGASPEEVEEGIILKIEENISGVDSIKEIKALALEGVGMVTATIDSGADADQVLQEIKSEVDRITTFPEDAEKPVTAKLVNRHEVVSLVVYGRASERALREWAEAMRDDLLAMEEITQAELSGVRPYEISIEVSEENLRRYGLTLEQVAQAVRRASLDLPGGAIKAKGGEILVRTKERRYLGPEYEGIIIRAAEDGSVVRLGDLAAVRDTFEETDTYATFDGMPAAMVRVYRLGKQKPLVIADVVRRYAEGKKADLPETVQVAVWNDNSEVLQSRIRLLLKNALLGLVLVLVTLSLFLQIRLALWVMLGIPISFLGALFLMPGLDVSINMVSLFAFIMALGIVVDDAVVVGENVYEHRQRGKSYLQAAVSGTQEVGLPVVFSVLTTVVAFVPLIFVEGVLGKFIRVIPLVVISILLVSLVESLFVLPAHLGLGKPFSPPDRGPARWLDRVRLWLAGCLERLIRGPYRWQLGWCLRFRFITLALAVAMLLITVGVVRGGLVKFRFMPEVDGDLILVNLEMPRGTLVEETGRIERLIVAAGKEVAADLDAGRENGSVLRHIYSVVGSTMEGGGPVGSSADSGAHLANVAMLLTASEVRGVEAVEVSRRWREKLGEIPGVEALTFTSNLMRMGANIDVQLAHDNIGMLAPAVARLKERLAQYPGVTDIADNYPLGKREVKIGLTEEARTLGVSEEELARQVRGAFYGAEALRLQRGRNEVKVMVRYPEPERRSLADLESMRIRLPSGGELPLPRAATLDMGRGYSEINRMDRKRVINVTATVDSRQANAEEILGDLRQTVLGQIGRDYPGMTYSLEGEEKERRESMASMLRGFVLALFGIYALLAIPFRSYSQPLLIMAAIPFGIVGAVFGHLLLGFNLSMLSLFGMVALSGVVINNSLLLIDYINRHRNEGKELGESVLEAGQRRFRPILLTSLTTFFGLMPMIFETSVQAQFLIPMAISLGFGVLFATGVTLLLVPTLYVALEHFRTPRQD